MTVSIRPAEISDLEMVADLLIQDAEQRHAGNQRLWPLDANAHQKTRSTLKHAMEDDHPPFRQQWLLAEDGGDIVGVSHTILLPVPPIYAGEFGPPGLIMEDCFVVENAPKGTRAALIKAAEADLIAAGAQILLASSVPGGALETTYASQGYAPLTLYFAKVGLAKDKPFDDVRRATEKDIPAIVASSADHRRILHTINTFWKPHAEADARFGNWMTRSLTLTDRDMFVSETEGVFEGYAISQPATPLHFPTPHDISRIGIIDDFYHADFEDPDTLAGAGHSARAMLQAAEAAREARGGAAVLVICPAAWPSKGALLRSAGYENAITWFIKR
ncbi:hypothetical protein [uncultured Roseobacter sp.]|uniref:hypothetical protein n=1 Tax=uncultured Roseobacter sp. TaxID=114847 RepID=UPI0026302A51|nr:hypothetical protein [uncultured Roseobacter sp.]